jgi:hypothetical protein
MTTGMNYLLGDDAAMQMLGLPSTHADEVAAMAPHAVASPKPGRRWHREKLIRWATVVGAVAVGFGPRKSSGARG